MSESDSGSMPGASPRRGFLKMVNYVVGGAVTAVLAWPVLRYLGFPVRRRVVAGGDDPVPVIDVARIVPGAPPVRVQIIAPEQRDAWSKQKHVPLGAAWVSRDDKGELLVLSATCPHLGCAVDYDPAKNQFRCPCHTSAFELDGKRIEGPAKRGMDPLEANVEGDQVMVRFARFKLDTSSREKA